MDCTGLHGPITVCVTSVKSQNFKTLHAAADCHFSRLSCIQRWLTLFLPSLGAGYHPAVPSAQGHARGFGGLFGGLLGGVHRDLMSGPRDMFGAIQQQQQQQQQQGGGGSASYVIQSSTVTYSGIGGQTYYSSSSSRQAAGNGVSNC